MQIDYKIYSLGSKKGQLADSGFHDIVSRIVTETIEIARAVVRVLGDATGKLIRLPVANVASVALAGTYTAGSFVVKVGGVTVTQAYTTDKATTLAALAVQIAALASVKSAVYTTDLLIVKMFNGVGPVAADFTGTLTGTITIVPTASSDDKIAGIALVTDSLVPDLVTGLVAYTTTGPQTANVLRRGRCFMYTETAITPDSTVYVRNTDDISDTTKLRGNLRADSASGLATANTDITVVVGASAGGLVEVEVNLP